MFIQMKKQITNSKIIKLKNNPVKLYAWGSTKDSCYVSQISQKKGLKNYAQLWMGMHPHGQSELQIGDSQEIIKFTQYFQRRGEKPLSYLFKILSIQQCLSIQVHPNKQQAIKWHKQKPQIYNDENDKPQMFYTLSEFQCFLGYVSKKQFDRLINLPIFSILPTKPQTPKQAIISILSLPENCQSILLQKSLDSLSEIHPDRYPILSHPSFPCPKLHSIPINFPNDIGIVVTFFLNYLVIPSGKCYYIGPNTPHAYIYGECLEIMKNSDNVLRLGLTPKGKDLGAVGEGLAQWDYKQGEGKSLESQVLGKDAKDGILYERQGLNLLIIKNKKFQKQLTKYKILPNPQTRVCLFLNQQVSIQSPSYDNTEHSSPQPHPSMASCAQIASTFLLQPETPYNLTYHAYKNRWQYNQKQNIVQPQPQPQIQIQAQQNILACIGWANF